MGKGGSFCLTFFTVAVVLFGLGNFDRSYGSALHVVGWGVYLACRSKLNKE